MDNLLPIFQWWGQHANILPWMFDHWVITWSVSGLLTAFLMGYSGATTGDSGELLGLMFVLAVAPVILGIVLFSLPVLLTFVIFILMLVGMFNLGDRQRRR